MPTTTVAKCTPSLGQVSVWWSRMTESVLWPSNTGKAIFYLRDKVGGEIAEVRNAIVESVLAYDAQANPVSHLFWVDDDVLVFSGALRELLSHKRDIASGVYFQKMPGRTTEPLIYPTKNGGADHFVPDRYYEVWGHGMGLTLVRAAVYKRMRDELNLGLDKYGRPRWYHTTGPDDAVEVDAGGTVHTGYTEDLFFLDNAARLGYRPLIDTTKHAFGFHYDAEKDVGYPEEQWRQWVAGEPIRWWTAAGEVVWN